MRWLLCCLLVACSSKPAKVPDPTKPRSDALFVEIAAVLTHPRCVNCHPADDTPRQGDALAAHDPPVVRGDANRGVVGMQCHTCHQEKNAELARIPGAPGWQLAPREMAWMGKTAGQICAQIKDPKRNGGKDMAALRVHLEDPLVTWGWNPGAGRTPIPTPYAEFVAAWETWARAGAPCPGG